MSRDQRLIEARKQMESSIMKVVKEAAEKNSESGYYPKAGDELRFYLKHLIKKYFEAEKNDGQFTSGNVKFHDRKGDRHGYNPGDDKKVYEAHSTRKVEEETPRTLRRILSTESTIVEGDDDGVYYGGAHHTVIKDHGDGTITAQRTHKPKHGSRSWPQRIKKSDTIPAHEYQQAAHKAIYGGPDESGKERSADHHYDQFKKKYGSKKKKLGETASYQDQLDELSKDTLQSYVNKNRKQGLKYGYDVEKDSYLSPTGKTRIKGAERAYERLQGIYSVKMPDSSRKALQSKFPKSSVSKYGLKKYDLKKEEKLKVEGVLKKLRKLVPAQVRANNLANKLEKHSDNISGKASDAEYMGDNRTAEKKYDHSISTKVKANDLRRDGRTLNTPFKKRHMQRSDLQKIKGWGKE